MGRKGKKGNREKKNKKVEKKMGEEVAGNPRRIKNFRKKSSYGVPLAYLLIWIANDIFNLVACLLEPVTELIKRCSVSSTSVTT